jgi:hypothetical protein
MRTTLNFNQIFHVTWLSTGFINLSPLRKFNKLEGFCSDVATTVTIFGSDLRTAQRTAAPAGRFGSTLVYPLLNPFLIEPDTAL